MDGPILVDHTDDDHDTQGGIGRSLSAAGSRHATARAAIHLGYEPTFFFDARRPGTRCIGGWGRSSGSAAKSEGS